MQVFCENFRFQSYCFFFLKNFNSYIKYNDINKEIISIESNHNTERLYLDYPNDTNYNINSNFLKESKDI